MKKTYAKPSFVVESFQLDAAIAASCSVNWSMAEEVCAADTGQEIYFASDACDDGINIKDNPDQYCYHGPILNVNAIFAIS